MAGLLDYLFDQNTYGGQGGLLSRLSPMLGQIPQSAGFPDLPQQVPPPQVATDISARSRQPQVLPVQAPQPEAIQPGFFDRLNSGLQSLGNGGSLIGAFTGNYTDPNSVAQQNLKAQYQAYIASGLPAQQALLAVLNPEAAKTFLPKISPTYQAHNIGSTVGSFNPATGQFAPSFTDTKYEKLGAGENLVAIGGPGGQARTVASGGPEKPPAGYQLADPNDPSKGLVATPGGPGTHLPTETAGRIAMMQTAAADLPAARKTLMEGRGTIGAGAGNVAGSMTGIGNYARAERTVTLAIEGALRAMTGAAAPETEVKRYKDLFMPGPLDSRETATQKLNQLDDFISNAQRLVTQGRGPAANNNPGRMSDPLGIR